MGKTSVNRNVPIDQFGLKNHLRSLGVDYKKFDELMHDGASISFMSRKFGYSRNAVRKWTENYHKNNS